MKIVLIDNYDSFVFNLAQYLQILGAETEVVRNSVSVDDVRRLKPGGIVISPGPGRPESAGCCIDLISQTAGEVALLGVCLGHQAIGLAFGGKVVQAPQVMHGKVSDVSHNSSGVFAGLPNPFSATRYHSLVIDPESLPTTLEVTAETHDGVIMGVKHSQHATEGVQFHPESILTSPGMNLLENFLKGLTRT